MTEKNLPNERLLTLSQVIEVLNVPRHRINYLFDSRRLRSEDFVRLPNGERIYRESDLTKIKQALFGIQSKG